MSNMYQTEGQYVIDWIEEHCVHPPGPYGGQPLRLETPHKDFIKEMYRFDADGNYVYRSIVFGAPRGWAKSTMAAALCLYETNPDNEIPYPRVVAAANTREQAKIVWGHAKAMVDNSPGLQQYFKTNTTSIWCEQNEGNFIRIAAEGKAQLGGQPSFVVKDEWAGWTTPNQVDLDEALQTSLIKRKDARTLAVSTAGWNKATLMGESYDAALKLDDVHRESGLTVCRNVEGKFLMWWIAAPDDADPYNPKTWAMVCPPWQDETDYSAAINDPGISIDKFRRQNLNQWTTSRNAWFDIGLWESRKSSRDIPHGSRIQVAIDASMHNDSTAVAWAYAPNNDAKTIMRARVWTAVPGDLCSPNSFFTDGHIDLREVVRFVTDDLAKKYRITEIAYDPRFLDVIAQDLKDARFRVVPIYPGTQPYEDAAQSFYTCVKSDLIEHDGDKVVAAHINATEGKQTERGWKIRKLDNTGHIDATVALMLANARARFAATKQSPRGYVLSYKELEEKYGKDKQTNEQEQDGVSEVSEAA